MAIYKPGTETSPETEFSYTLILDFRSPEWLEIKFLLFRPPSVVLCYGIPRKLTQVATLKMKAWGSGGGGLWLLSLPVVYRSHGEYLGLQVSIRITTETVRPRVPTVIITHLQLSSVRGSIFWQYLKVYCKFWSWVRNSWENFSEETHTFVWMRVVMLLKPEYWFALSNWSWWVIDLLTIAGTDTSVCIARRLSFGWWALFDTMPTSSFSWTSLRCNLYLYNSWFPGRINIVLKGDSRLCFLDLFQAFHSLKNQFVWF